MYMHIHSYALLKTFLFLNNSLLSLWEKNENNNCLFGEQRSTKIHVHSVSMGALFYIQIV